MKENNSKLKWLEIAREMQQLAQTGAAFAVTDYEKQRYKRLTEITAEIIEHHTDSAISTNRSCVCSY